MLFNGMIRPLTPFRIKGVIWYQGESNAVGRRAAQYRTLFPSRGSGLQVMDRYGYARGFEVAGADGKFHWAQAYQDGQDIMVFSEEVQKPAAVRYDWSNAPGGNVYSREGLPAILVRAAAYLHQ